MSLDLQLFVEQALWLGPKLRDPSRRGVLAWFTERLDSDLRNELMRQFPLLHPVQLKAEHAVCDLIKRSIVTQPVQLRSVGSVTRSVDWPATYAKASCGARPPLPYLARVRYSVPDRSCLSALATLIHSWRRLLKLAVENPVFNTSEKTALSTRQSELERALPPQLARGLVPVGFERRHAIRLRALDDIASSQVDAVEAALSFWAQLFGGSDTPDGEAFAALGRRLLQSDVENIFTLMETTVALSIARAAEQADDRQDWPTEQRWKIISVEATHTAYPAIRLQSGDLICELSKGTPRETPMGGARRAIPDLLSSWTAEALQTSERSRPRARQPDVVVTFWLESDPTNIVFVLGDAKRNATGGGERYLRDSIDVAATYLMAFGYRMGMQLPQLDAQPILTALTPGVTLFCLQATNRDATSAINVFRADSAPPVVMALDLEKHFVPEARPWHAPVLAAWLGSLGRQAVRRLARSDRRVRRIAARVGS